MVDTGRCDECRCGLGEAAANDDCECPCHCDCCCPPLAHCMDDCTCACDCHYEINDSDEDGDRETQVEAAQRMSSEHLQLANSQEANDDIVLETSMSATGSTPSSQPRDDKVNAQHEQEDGRSDDDQQENGQAQEQRHSSTNASTARATTGERNEILSEQGPSDDDEDMNGTAPLRRSLEKLSIGQLATLLAKNLPLTDEQAEINNRRVTKALFTQVYKSALAGGKPNKNANAHLPETTPDEEALLYTYLTTLNNQLRYTTTRLTAALKDVAVAAVRSAWTLTRILEDRIALARTPRAPPVNVWSQPSGTEGAVNKLTGATIFRFDSTVYSASEADRLRAICEQEHVFAATTRSPTEDEWTIMQGLMSGSVIARALPQFLKRCTTLAQIVWIHEEIMQRAEGELWVSLPAMSQMYNYNQTTRRLAGEIRQAAIHQKWTDNRLEQMMTTVKSIAYNPVMHAIHFYFYTKAEAKMWEGMLIPFRTTKLRLNNPDTRLNSSRNEHGPPTDEDDGLVNDRYQAHYKLRLGNLSRTMNLAALVRFLQKLTNQGLKSCMPLDTYGPHAEGSVLWDFISQTAECPEQLRDVYRIDWNGHLISVHHRPDTSPPPCLQCAQVGHQAAKCATPQEEWNTTTIKVSSQAIHQLSTAQPAWKTREELQKIFEGLATSKGSEASLAPATENESTEIPQPQPEDPPAQTPEPAQPIPTSTTAASQLPPPRPAPQNTTYEPTEWTTVGSKTNPPSTKASADSSGPRMTPPTAAAAAPSPSKPLGNNTNTFINLVDDDDDDDSDYEDERAPDHPGTPPLESSTTPDPQQPDATTAAEDDDLIQRAVHRAQKERLRDIFFNMIHQQEPLHDPRVISDAIQKALPHVAPKTSCAWLLEAIGGRLTETPSTGNCQNYATIEAIFQKDMKHAQDTEPMIAGTMILKYGAYLAHLSGSDAERRNSALTAIMDVEEGTPMDRTPADEAKMITKFFKDLACSGSQLRDILPKRLWGCLDTIRMFSSFLGIPIFLISATSDPTVCYLNVFRQRKNKAGDEFTAISQPGVADWLAELEAENKRANCAPVVLVHNNAHYNCVISDRTTWPTCDPRPRS